MKKFERQMMPDGIMLVNHLIDPNTTIQVIIGNNNDLEGVYISKVFQNKTYHLHVQRSNSQDVDVLYHLLKRTWKWYKSQLILDYKKYKIEPSVEDENFWVCIDLEYFIVCKFENKNFNENQSFTEIDDMNVPPVDIAAVIRKMSDWLRQNHYDKIF